MAARGRRSTNLALRLDEPEKRDAENLKREEV